MTSELKTKTVRIEAGQVVACPACGQAVVVIELVDGSRVPVQPIPVQPVVPARPKIILAGPTPPDLAIKKMIEGTWEGTLGAPVFIPHPRVCLRNVDGPPALMMGLDVPISEKGNSHGTHQEPHLESGDGNSPRTEQEAKARRELLEDLEIRGNEAHQLLERELDKTPPVRGES